MDYSEFDYNIAEGEFSTKSEKKTVSLILGEVEYEISAIVGKAYARREVDGRFTTDIPTFTLSVIISLSQIPQTITEEDYTLLNVRVDGKEYSVRHVTGTGILTLTLKPLDGVGYEPEDPLSGTDCDDNEVV